MNDISKTSGKYLIINADDFGWSRGVNEGIIQAHKEGILTSATLFANAPDTRDAIALAQESPCLDVGIHLCYGPWPPIMPVAMLDVLFKKDGSAKFSTSMLWSYATISKKARHQLYLHFKSQIEHLKMLGLRPTHLDTHKHLHYWPIVMEIVCRLAYEFDIPAVRLPLELPFSPFVGPINIKARAALCVLSPISFVSSLYFAYIKYGRVTPHRLVGIAQTGHWTKQRFLNTLKHISESRTGIARIFEIMVHPGKSYGLDPKQTRLIESREAELDILTDNEIKEYISQCNNIKLITFSEIPTVMPLPR